jgi:hypothetical protein
MASQALTTELRTIRENSSVDITEQIEKLCRISVERDEMQRKLNEAGNNSMALNEAHEQVRLVFPARLPSHWLSGSPWSRICKKLLGGYPMNATPKFETCHADTTLCA